MWCTIHDETRVSKNLCYVDECTKVGRKGGLWVKHYTENHGVPSKNKQCCLDECTQFVKMDGLCKKHYTEKHGVPAKMKQCCVDECTNFSQKGGLCGVHYRKKHEVTMNLCLVDECTKVEQKGDCVQNIIQIRMGRQQKLNNVASMNVQSFTNEWFVQKALYSEAWGAVKNETMFRR